MTLFTNELTYNHPWHIMTMASWRKYPNKHASQVISVDIINRSHHPETPHILETERLITCKPPVSNGFLRSVLGIPEVIMFREISSVDTKSGKHIMYSENLTMRCLAVLTERTEYHKDSHMTTSFKQEASVDVKGALGHVARKFENLAVNSFKNNANNGKRALDSVIDIIKREMNDLEQVALSAKASSSAAVSV